MDVGAPPERTTTDILCGVCRDVVHSQGGGVWDHRRAESDEAKDPWGVPLVKYENTMKTRSRSFCPTQ